MRMDSLAAGNAFLTPVAFIVSIEPLGHNFFFCFEMPPLGAVAFLLAWRCNTNAGHIPGNITIKSCVYCFHGGPFKPFKCYIELEGAPSSTQQLEAQHNRDPAAGHAQNTQKLLKRLACGG